MGLLESRATTARQADSSGDKIDLVHWTASGARESAEINLTRPLAEVEAPATGQPTQSRTNSTCDHQESICLLALLWEIEIRRGKSDLYRLLAHYQGRRASPLDGLEPAARRHLGRVFSNPLWALCADCSLGVKSNYEDQTEEKEGFLSQLPAGL